MTEAIHPRRLPQAGLANLVLGKVGPRSFARSFVRSFVRHATVEAFRVAAVFRRADRRHHRHHSYVFFGRSFAIGIVFGLDSLRNRYPIEL